MKYCAPINFNVFAWRTSLLTSCSIDSAAYKTALQDSLILGATTKPPACSRCHNVSYGVMENTTGNVGAPAGARAALRSESVTDGMLDVAPDAGIPGQPTVGGQRSGAV
ncbi:MAG TPA: hypothetical protein VGQ46_20280 [Thermoanaerobaculia bacterium]|nr:hypothetical protein [Thermoanaerobaculia bacterium]